MSLMPEDGLNQDSFSKHIYFKTIKKLLEMPKYYFSLKLSSKNRYEAK